MVLHRIMAYVGKMLPFFLITMLVFGLGRSMLLRKRGCPNHLREGALWFFAAYLGGLASLTVLPPIQFAPNGMLSIRRGPGGVNLIPFIVFRQTWAEVFEHGNLDYFLINFIGNLVMFMPVGFFVALLWQDSGWKRAAIAGFGCSLCIELCQLPIGRGTDIDDLWLNTCGALLGFLLLSAAQRLIPNIIAKFRPPA